MHLKYWLGKTAQTQVMEHGVLFSTQQTETKHNPFKKMY